MEKQILTFEHFRTDLGDGVRTGVYFNLCSGRCNGLCSPCKMIKEHPFGEDTKEADLYSADLLAEYLREEKIWYYKAPLGITFLGKNPLSDPHFCFEVGRKLKENDMSLYIVTCGNHDAFAFDLVSGVCDLFCFRFFSPIPGVNKKIFGPDFERVLDNLYYLDRSNYPYRILIPLLPGINDTSPVAMASFVENFKNKKSVILDFSHVSFSEEEKLRWRRTFLERNIVLY